MFRPRLLQSLRPPPPLGLQSISALQQYSFVDKTDKIAKLLSGAMGPFLHVPAMRRVGKSFTLTMLAAMARGEREPFKGYAAASPTSPYTIGASKFHVIRFNFAASVAMKSGTLQENQQLFVEAICDTALRQHKIHVALKHHPGLVLADYLWQLHQAAPIPFVILVDEYDGLVSMYLPDEPAKAEAMAEFLASFYGQIKIMAELFHLVYVTGIGKFAQLSMFSSANMFTTLMECQPAYATLYGFTEEEIRHTYGHHITNTMHRDLDSTMQQLKAMYNGYKIHPAQEETTFNPWSVLNFLQHETLDPYWCTTGGNMAANYLGANTTELLRGFSMAKTELFAPIAAQEHPYHWKQVAVQTGYATISHFNPTTSMVDVGVPNEEVRSWLQYGMIKYLVGHVDKQALRSYASTLQSRDFNSAGKHLQSLLRSIPVVSRPTNESQFEGYALHCLHLKELGFTAVLSQIQHPISVDPHTKAGHPSKRAAKRLDGMLVYEDGEGAVHIFVMEFKVDHCATVALQQIRTKHYTQRAREYLAENAPAYWQTGKIYAVGLNLKTSDITVEVAFEEL